MDPRTGRWASVSLGDYLVPVNADAPEVDVELIEVDNHVTGPLGVKGVGEIGQVGSGSAIANAVAPASELDDRRAQPAAWLQVTGVTWRCPVPTGQPVGRHPAPVPERLAPPTPPSG